MQYLQKLDKLAHEMQTDIERFKYYQAKAALLQESKDYVDAIVYYRKIVDMLRSGYKDVRDYEHYKNLSKCYLAMNNLSLAYDYMTQAYALRDSVFQTEETDQLSEYSVKYRTKEKELEIVSLRREQLEQETYMLRHRIIVGSVISLLGILLLGSLYARQRQRARIALLANAACEKEREFLELQKETEQRLTRKYIDGLESERERMATELHDDVCNNLLALEMKKSYRSKKEKDADRNRLECLTKDSFNHEWSFDGTEPPEHVCRYAIGIYYEIDFDKNTISIEYYRKGKYHTKDKKLIKKGTD